MSLKRMERTLFLMGLLAATFVLATLSPPELVQRAFARTSPSSKNYQFPQDESRSEISNQIASAVVLPQSNAALNFDGSNDIVDGGDVSVLNGVSQYTIEAWVKFDSFFTYETVFAKRVTDVDRAAMLQVWEPTGEIAVAVDHGYGHTSDPLSPNTWYHIAIVYDGTQATDADRLKLFVDGSLKALTFLSPGSVPAKTPSTASRFTLGAEYSGMMPIDTGSSIQVPFDGTIDEVRIWNFARTQAQIQADKDIELIGLETGLEVYYNFNQGIPNSNNSSLTTLNDRAGTAQDGTLWNFELNGPSSNWVDGAPFVYKIYMPLVIRNN